MADVSRDIGCGHGITTTIMAQAFPQATFIGLDFHVESIEAARAHAAQHNLNNLSFDVSLAKDVPGQFDLVTIFDCLHDMGDPVGAMQHIRESLAPGGACMIVEPMAGDSLADNLNPVSRLYYNASTMVCVPNLTRARRGHSVGCAGGRKTAPRSHYGWSGIQLIPPRRGNAVQHDS